MSENMCPAEMAPYLSWMCAQKNPSRLRTQKTRKTSCCRLYHSKGEYLTARWHCLSSVSTGAQKWPSALSWALYPSSTATRAGATASIACPGEACAILAPITQLRRTAFQLHCRHPHSVDALCALPSTYPSSHNTILTGSSDGLLRVIELLPTRLVGVIADHGDFPIERIAIDRGGEGRWVGSAGHDEVLRMTDLREVLDDEGERAEAEADSEGGDVERDASDGEEPVEAPLPLTTTGTAEEDSGDEKKEADDKSSGDESDVPRPKKRRKNEKGDLKGRPSKRGKNQVDVDPSFFSGL